MLLGFIYKGQLMEYIDGPPERGFFRYIGKTADLLNLPIEMEITGDGTGVLITRKEKRTEKQKWRLELEKLRINNAMSIPVDDQINRISLQQMVRHEAKLLGKVVKTWYRPGRLVVRRYA